MGVFLACLLIVFTLPTNVRMIDEEAHIRDLTQFSETYDIRPLYKGPAFYGTLNIWTKFFGSNITSLRSSMLFSTVASCVIWIFIINIMKIRDPIISLLMFASMPTFLTISFMVMSEPLAMLFLLIFILFLLRFFKQGSVINIVVSAASLSLLLTTRQNMAVFIYPALLYLFFSSRKERSCWWFGAYLLSLLPLLYCFIVWNGFVSEAHQAVFSFGVFPRTVIVALIYVGMFFWPAAIQLWKATGNEKYLLIALGVLFYIFSFTAFNVENFYAGALSGMMQKFQLSQEIQLLLFLPFFIIGILIVFRSLKDKTLSNSNVYFFNLLFFFSMISWLFVGQHYFARYAIFNIVFIIPYMSAIPNSSLSKIWFSLLTVLNIVYIYKFAI